VVRQRAVLLLLLKAVLGALAAVVLWCWFAAQHSASSGESKPPHHASAPCACPQHWYDPDCRGAGGHSPPGAKERVQGCARGHAARQRLQRHHVRALRPPLLRGAWQLAGLSAAEQGIGVRECMVDWKASSPPDPAASAAPRTGGLGVDVIAPKPQHQLTHSILIVYARMHVNLPRPQHRIPCTITLSTSALPEPMPNTLERSAPQPTRQTCATSASCPTAAGRHATGPKRRCAALAPTNTWVAGARGISSLGLLGIGT
jgi:hypothetical protein